MFFKLVTYHQERHRNNKYNFYIQSKGNNAGRPLRTPKPNCWAVETNIKNAYELCSVLWMSKIYKNLIKGSVVPFLTIHDYLKITKPFLNNAFLCEGAIIKGLEAINQIDNLINATLSKLELIKEMKASTTNKVIFQIKSKM